jgi:hypothetical protein
MPSLAEAYLNGQIILGGGVLKLKILLITTNWCDMLRESTFYRTSQVLHEKDSAA